MTADTSQPASVCVAMAAYDEAVALDSLLERWQGVLARMGRPYRFVVVDDGSRDATPDILRGWAARLPLRVITHAVNLGLGAGLRDALSAAAEEAQPGDVIVTMDSDATHPPELLPDMLDSIESEGADVVIASRYRQGSEVVGLSGTRTLASLCARLLYGVVFPIAGVRDYTCGYRAFRASCLQSALAEYGDRFFQEPGFEATADILIKLAPLGFRFAEVPFVLRYDMKGGASKMRFARTVWRSVVLLARRRFDLRGVKRRSRG